MVENDRSTNNNHVFKGIKELTWEQVKLTFGIQDSFDYISGPTFTWDNWRLINTRIFSRLDRFYSYTNPMCPHKKRLPT